MSRNGLYRGPIKRTWRPKTTHERVIAKCLADGLIDAEHNITPAGQAWCDRLMIELGTKEQKLAQRYNPDLSR